MCWALCSENYPSTNGENDAFRRVKSCVNWHLAAGCSTGLIIIWQPPYLTHRQLNVWPDVTGCRSRDHYLEKQGENVTGVPAAQRTIPAKNQERALWKLSWAVVFASRDKQRGRRCRLLAEGQKIKPWWDTLRRSQVGGCAGFADLTELWRASFQRTSRTAALSSHWWCYQTLQGSSPLLNFYDP